MRILRSALLPFSLLVACVAKQPPVVASTDAVPPVPAPAATAAPTSTANAAAAAAASEARPAPVHQVSEVEPPPVGVQSQPLPGFMRGINLGNALDGPTEGAWGVTLEPAHFSMAKAAGLDHVRLPVRFSAHAEPKAPFKIDEAFFKRVDWAIEQAANNGLSIIIDLHHYEELMKKPSEHGDRLLGLWKQIAERYKSRPASVVFELVNEPCEELKPELLNPITKRVLAAVRASNPKRTVIVDSYFWASAERLKDLDLPQDANLVPSFHNYQPILFTHQGMPWMTGEFQTRGVVFPGPPAVKVTPVPAGQQTDWVSRWFASYNDRPIADNANGPKAIFDYYKLVEDYMKSTKRRVYMGEFGVSDNVDDKSRESWLRIVRQEAEKRHIGWALWDDGGRFRAMNVKQGTWVEPIRAGLFQ